MSERERPAGTPPRQGNLRETLDPDLLSLRDVAQDLDENVARRRAGDAARRWIAKTIIWIFTGTVVSVQTLLLIRGLMDGGWDAVTSQTIELVKSVVLPVVTLILGYYFGRAERD